MYVYIAGALIAYLVGGLSPALFISWCKKKNIRSHGTGNLGASNTTILIGAKWGVLVAVLDILKAYIPVTVAKLMFSEYEFMPYIVATAVILGHIFPFYLKFKGGKGFATYMGAMLGISLNAFLIIGFIFLVVLFESDYIVLGTLTVVSLFPIYLWFASKNIYYVLILLIASVVIFIKHRTNIVKIINRKEIGLSEAFSGKHKI